MALPASGVADPAADPDALGEVGDDEHAHVVMRRSAQRMA
jgi:hypothetical protein